MFQGTNDCFVFTNVDGHPVICRPTGDLCLLILHDFLQQPEKQEVHIFIIHWFPTLLTSEFQTTSCAISHLGYSLL